MNFRSNNKKDLRLFLVLCIYVFISCIFVFRLFHIQILNHDKFRAMAQGQYWNEESIPSKRGDIKTSDGYSLATNQISYILYAEPKKILEKTKYAENLAQILSPYYASSPYKNPDKKTVNELRIELYDKYLQALEMDLFWVALERSLPPDMKELVVASNLTGVGFEDEPLRFYPESDLASHVLGFVASDERGQKIGYFGIEGYFDGDLRGKEGKIIEEKDALGEPILVGGYKRIDPIPGRNVVLTLDRSVQYLVEKRLKEGVQKYNAISGSVIVMDPFTGDVISMANYPTYHPGEFGQIEAPVTKENPRKNLERRNLSISETYEPGSVIKALTMSAALELGKVTPTSTFVDDGPVRYSDYYINNWNGKHHGVQTMIQLLQKSNNIGAAYVGHLVGTKDLSDYFYKFGFGVKSGIELEGEDSGIIRNYQDMTDIDLATMAFGQGISATQLQVLNAFNVLANGGKLMRPRIVSKIIDADKTLDIPVKQVRQVISKSTSDTITDMLISTVDGGEGKFFNLKIYKIAGKTGTAQIPFEGKYDPSKTNTTFVGYLSESRKFSMIVRLDRPESSIFAAETAVPLFMKITDDLTKYYGIVPDRSESEVDQVLTNINLTEETGSPIQPIVE